MADRLGGGGDGEICDANIYGRRILCVQVYSIGEKGNKQHYEQVFNRSFFHVTALVRNQNFSFLIHTIVAKSIRSRVRRKFRLGIGSGMAVFGMGAVYRKNSFTNRQIP